MNFKKYPSIEQYRHLIIKLKKYKYLPDLLNFTGTVKLHGTNAGINYIKGIGSNISIQSRNRILSEEYDNLGCFNFLNTRIDNIINLCNNMHGTSILIVGEFCGKGIQTGVGISKLDVFFVIFDICIDDKWQSIDKFSNIFDIANRIYNITQFEKFKFSIDRNLLDNEEYINIKNEELQNIAETIGKQCPVSKYFNVIGEGEGIVWKYVDAPGNYNLWFKSKCEKHSLRSPKVIKNIKINDDDIVLNFVTNARLLQGIDYLREFNLLIDKTSLGVFIKWIVDDIIKEESIDKKYNKYISNKSREWFLEYIKSHFR